jgi:hypothetical protein
MEFEIFINQSGIGSFSVIEKGKRLDAKLVNL